MRRSSPPSLKYLATTATETAMSSRPPYQYRPRGGRNGTRGRGELVTRDGNQQRGRGGFPNQLEFQTLPVNRSPHVNQNQPFIRPIPHSNRPLSSQPYPYGNQNHHLSLQPPFEQNQPIYQYPYRLQPPGSPLQFCTVIGDSHYRSVRDGNLHFRQGARGGFSNRPGFQAPPPHFTQYQPFNHMPRFNADQPLNPTPHVNQNQSFNTHLPSQQNQSIRQPRPIRIQRPSESIHREWEYARPGPPLHCDRFIVLSYNLLADYLAINHWDQLYSHIPNHMLEWNWRKRNIIYELGWWSADIFCFQEVDRFHELEDELKTFGYSGIWKMRTGDAVDGCAIFWRASRFKLLQEECIEYNKLGLRNNVAQICVLESLRQNNTASVPTSSTGSNKVVICNIHVLFNPKRGEIKLGQVRILLEKAHAISKIWNDAPIVFCGDFNCTPKSPLYNFFSEQKLDLTSLARDKVSGQDSCVIRSPRQFSGYQGVPSAYVSVRPPTVIKGLDIGANQTGQNVSDVLGESAINGNNTKTTAPSDQTSKEHCKGSEIGYKDETEASSFEPSFQSDDGSQADKTMEIKPSDHAYIDSDIKDTEHKEDVNASSFSDNGYSCKHPASNLSQVSVSNASTSIDSTPDEKIVKLLVYEPDEDMKGETNVEKEDYNTFLSELHNTDGDFSSNIGKFGSTDPVERGSIEKDGSQGDTNQNKISPDMDFAPYRTFYDPSSWTPVEIETATGNAECTIIEHPLKLRSTYTEVENLPHTRDVNGEPEVTSYNKCFLGTVDYIWRSEGLQTVRTLAPIPKHAMQWTRGFPTKKWGSDHIALASELAFVRDTTDENMQLHSSPSFLCDDTTEKELLVD